MKTHGNKSSLLLSLVFCALVACHARTDDIPTYTNEGHYKGVDYVTAVYEHDFEGVKDWDPSQAPPLPFQQVIKLASDAIKSIPAVGSVELKEISFTKIDYIGKWFYVVSFGNTNKEKIQDDLQSGKFTQLSVVVLTNGKVILPRKSDLVAGGQKKDNGQSP